MKIKQIKLKVMKINWRKIYDNSPVFKSLLFKSLQNQVSGSLMIFSLGLFLILFSLTFITMNLVGIYSAKRELISTTEAALSSSSQNLDSLFYYSELNRLQTDKKVPINCVLAKVDFFKKINVVTVQGKPISIESFGCDGFNLRAIVQIRGALPLKVPLLNFFNSNTSNSDLFSNLSITASVGVTSPYR